MKSNNVSAVQFYQNGPYLHATGHNDPYSSLAYGFDYAKDDKAVSELDGIIAKMQAREAAFYALVGVSGKSEFESKFLVGTKDIQMVQDQKMDPIHIIIKEIGQYLASKEFVYKFVYEFNAFIGGDPDKFISDMLGTGGTEVLRNLYNREVNVNDSKMFDIDYGKLNSAQMVEFINVNVSGLKARAEKLAPVLDASSNSAIARLLFSAVRLRPLKNGGGPFDHPSVKGRIQSFFRQYLLENKKRVENDVRNKIYDIFNKHDVDKKYDDRIKNKIYLVVANQVDNWLVNERSIVRALSTKSNVIGTVGEFAYSFIINLNSLSEKELLSIDQRVLVSKVTQSIIGDRRGSSKIGIYDPVTKEITYKTKKDQTAHAWARKQMASDIAFTMTDVNGNVLTFNIQSKNSLSDIIEDEQVGIRGSTPLKTLIADIESSGAGIGIEGLDKFIYVLVNTIYRNAKDSAGGALVNLLSDFIARTAMFYLQSEMLDAIKYKGRDSFAGSDIGNSFIVYKHRTLIPMSDIFIKIRDGLKVNERDGVLNTTVRNFQGNISSLFKQDFEGTRQTDLVNALNANKDQPWIAPPIYGARVLRGGIGFGTALFNQVRMPGVYLNISKLYESLT